MRFRRARAACASKGRTALLACVVAAALTATCEGAGDAPAPNAAPEGPVEWVLDSVPSVEIGVVGGDERYEFVSVYSGWVHPDGRIVVFDRGRLALLFYDSTGTFLSRAGGRGAGPGEFQFATRAWRYRGDSIATYDLALQRLTVFDAQGNVARSFINPMRYGRKPGTIPSQSCCAIRGSFADGSFLGHPPDDIPVEPGPPRHSTFTPVRVYADGSGVDTIGTFDSALFEQEASGPNGVSGYETSYSFRYGLLSDRILGGNGMFDGLVAAIVSGPPEGSAASTTVTLDTLPLPGEPMPFTPELKAEYEAALRADYEARGGRFYEGSLESNLPGEFPPTAPRFVNVHDDDDDRVWLQRWTPLYGRLGARVIYDILSATGRHVATVELPPDSWFLWSRGDRVMLTQRDSLDVQYVRLYRMSAASGG